MELSNMTVGKEDGVATLTLNRPNKMNAMTTKMWKDFRRAINSVGEDDKIKVLILTGNGPAFCAGSDVEDRLAARIEGKKVDNSARDLLEPLHYVASNLRALDKVTIAAINGTAVGAGLSLALLCDLRLASERAHFGATWVRMGLIADLGLTYTLPRTLGVPKAMELMLSGEIIDADEAQGLGLVTKVIAHEKLMEEVSGMASKIANGPSVAINLMKRAVYRGLHNDLLMQLDFEGYAQSLCLQTEDHKEAVKAFLEKREPRFIGA
jgi:2-(1,2-epoxy-1,2-dihydrophenyl)acetyl-CoA isomerase